MHIAKLPPLKYRVNGKRGSIHQASRATIDSTDQVYENMAKAKMGHQVKL